MFTLGVDRDQAIVTVPVEEGYFLGALQNFERKAAGIVTRDPTKNTQALGIDRGCEVMFQSRLSGGRQRKLQPGQILRHIADWLGVTCAFPVAAQIRMAVGRPGRRLRFSSANVGNTQSVDLLAVDWNRNQSEGGQYRRKLRALISFHGAILLRLRLSAILADPNCGADP